MKSPRQTLQAPVLGVLRICKVNKNQDVKKLSPLACENAS